MKRKQRCKKKKKKSKILSTKRNEYEAIGPHTLSEVETDNKYLPFSFHVKRNIKIIRFFKKGG